MSNFPSLYLLQHLLGVSAKFFYKALVQSMRNPIKNTFPTFYRLNNTVSFLSLKEVLAGVLEATLFSACEDNPIHFMLASHKTRVQEPFSRKITLRRPIHWRNIPIEKKQAAGTILYTSALPHIVAHQALRPQTKALAQISNQLANQLNQARLQTLNSDLDHDDDLLLFVRQLWSEFKIETRRPGWIALHLSNRGIDLWIQQHQKVFQTNQKHTQLFLHDGALSQMSYSLFKSVDHADRDHNKSAFQQSDQRPNQSTFTQNLRDSFGQTTSQNNVPKQEFPGPNASNRALSRQESEAQLIPARPTSHRHIACKKLPVQQTLRPKQRQLADHWLWQVQYTYARACSLIEQWQALQGKPPLSPSPPNASVPKQITTGSLKPKVSIGTTTKRASKPMAQSANCSRPSEHQASREWDENARTRHAPITQQHVAQQLIASLVEVADHLFWIPYRWPSQQYFLLLKGSALLYQAFEAFSSHCLVGFGQVSQGEGSRPTSGTIHPAQAHFQAQFDLVIATQSVLKVLLEAYLAAPAPTEL